MSSIQVSTHKFDNPDDCTASSELPSPSPGLETFTRQETIQGLSSAAWTDNDNLYRLIEKRFVQPFSALHNAVAIRRPFSARGKGCILRAIAALPIVRIFANCHYS
jgi:hypothetical protein